MASVSFARNDVEDAKDLCKKMGFRIDFYGFNEDTVDGNPAPKGWFKPYKEWDVYHLSTGAGFRDHPQYHGDIMGYIYIYIYIYVYIYIINIYIYICIYI